VDSANTFYAATDSGVFTLASNAGSWNEANYGLSRQRVNALQFGSQGSIFAGTDTNFFFYYDYVGSWLPADSGMSRHRVLSISIRSDSIVVAAVADSGVFRSTDYGRRWKRINKGLSDSGNVIVVKFIPDGTLFALTRNSVFRSSNNGDTWDEANSGLQGFYFQSIALNKDGKIFVGNSSGIDYSSDHGETWTYNNNIQDIRCLALDSQGYLYGGMYNYGVYRTSQRTTAVPDHIAERIPDFKLDQNYPNPFNPQTTIEYSIPANTLVHLAVYDILGREVLRLVDEYKQAGRYDFRFNASGLSSGVYFYRLQTGKFVESKKLLLMK
jgi:hypothetical protein